MSMSFQVQLGSFARVCTLRVALAFFTLADTPQMTDSVHRKPRNPRLSAYYGLSTPASPSIPAPPSPDSIPIDRDKALANAAHLTQTLPLPALLQHSTHLRSTSESLHRELHTSIRRYYTHLAAASDVAQASIAQVSALRPAASIVSDCATLAEGVNGRLQATRQRVDALEGARRATLLREAAVRLAEGLPPAYRELVDLCTDPAAARDRLFLMAKRAAVVLPAVERLVANSDGFAEPAEKLRKAMEEVRTELAKGNEKDDPYGMPVSDSLQLRRFLGDEPTILLDAFCKAFARRLCRQQPSEAALAAAGPAALARSEIFLMFAVDKTVAQAYEVGDRFGEIFGGGEEDVWSMFAVWLSDVLDECIAARARGPMRSQDTHSWGAVDQVKSYLAAIERLEKASAAEAANRQRRENIPMQTASRHVNEVIHAMVTELRSGVQDALTTSTVSAWQKVVRDIVAGARSIRAVDELISTVRASQQKSMEFGEGHGHEAEEQVLRNAAAFAIREAQHESKIAPAVWAAILIRELGKKVKGVIREEFQVLSENQLAATRERILEHVNNTLHIRLHSIKGLQGGAGASGALSDAAEILKQAEAVGEELDVDMIRCNEAEDDFLGGEESLVKGVRELWTDMVRKTSIANEKGVREVQLDVFELEMWLGNEGSFAGVTVAAKERCVEEVTLLSKSELLAGLEERRRGDSH